MAASGRSAAAAASSLGRLVNQRSLYVRVQPAPVSLAERRSVLRVLQSSGKIEMFKKLVDSGSFISIASSPEVAAALVERSPMTYEFIAEKFGALEPWGTPGITAPIRPIETSPPPSTEKRGERMRVEDEYRDEDKEAEEIDESPSSPLRHETEHMSHKSFVVSVFPSLDYQHREAIRYSPLYGPWPKGETDPAAGGGHDTSAKETSYVYRALQAVVPEGEAHEAFCDWQTGGQLAAEEPRPPRSKMDHIRERIARRQQARKNKARRSAGMAAAATAEEPATDADAASAAEEAKNSRAFDFFTAKLDPTTSDAPRTEKP